MLYSAGAVAVIQPLPNPVSGIIDTTGSNYNPDGYYVSNDPSASTPASVSAEITYDDTLILYGNIVNASASGAVDGKTFNVSSKLSLPSGLNSIWLYAGYSNGNGAVTNNILNFEGSTDGKIPNNFHLYGGYSENGSVERNIVESTGSINAKSVKVYGGDVFQGSGSATNNKIYVAGNVNFV